jgi:UDP-N-acetylglucosamine acyltransferase
MPENRIHPTAHLDERVILGDGNIIGPYAVILGPTRVGNDNWIGPGAVIGTPGESRGGLHPPSDEAQGIGVVIGDRNVIREMVTIQQGVIAETVIGNDCYLMTKSHVPHEAELEDGVTLACAAQIGGHGWVGRGANLGLGAQVLQRSCIGAFAMVGMNATVTRHIPPFALAKGTPAKVTGANRVGMSRRQIPEEVIARLDAHYGQGSLETPEWIESPLLEEFVHFDERRRRHE